MFNQKKYYNFYIYVILILISFFINFYVGSQGVFPVDTFIHYDSGFRILLGENPVKDYWIVHGFIIDYIQAIFFKVFGNNWYAYIIHSSLFNLIITLSSYSVFRLLKIEINFAFLISLAVAFLAYPVSGTPFLDLHSSYFSLLAIYFLIFAMQKEKNIYWFYASILLCLAFFSKQVPAFYTIIAISFVNIYSSIIKKKINIFIYFSSGAVFFILILFLFLLIQKIPIKDFVLQVILFPPSIGTDRYETYNLSYKNIILDFKYIYLFYLLIFFINIFNLIKNKKYYQSTNFIIFLILSSYVITTIFHQIYTKNQIYIFFLVPILVGFSLYYKNYLNLKKNNYFSYFILFICLLITLKYHMRFNIERKFHELNNVIISNSIEASQIDKKFSGLNWISPYYAEPQKEIDIINSFMSILKKDNSNKMVITSYNFYSSLLNERLYSPSRTYDSISYPGKNSKYFDNYKQHLINIIKKNKITKIYIFKPLLQLNINELVFNYIPERCFKIFYINKNVINLEILNCEILK
jgi:hypothetical protein